MGFDSSTLKNFPITPFTKLVLLFMSLLEVVFNLDSAIISGDGFLGDDRGGVGSRCGIRLDWRVSLSRRECTSEFKL